MASPPLSGAVPVWRETRLVVFASTSRRKTSVWLSSSSSLSVVAVLWKATKRPSPETLAWKLLASAGLSGEVPVGRETSDVAFAWRSRRKTSV
jgi:hypothetical protein